MSNESKRSDFYSGVPWVNVTPEQARAHPLGTPGLLIWVIAAYFLSMSLLKFYLTIDFGAGFLAAILNSVWPFLVGIGLLIRAPWSVLMAAVSAGLTIWALIRGISGPDNAGSLIYLLQTIANVGILFYLIDGDRPNLIYRHRYRKYSVLQEDGDATTAPVDRATPDR